MKRYTTFSLLLFCLFVKAQDGFNINITYKPFRNQQVYISHYYGSGSQFSLLDSVWLNEQSSGAWKGKKKPGDGIYLLSAPNARQAVPFIIDQNTTFSIMADTLSPGTVQFRSSPENTHYAAYQAYIRGKSGELQAVMGQLYNKAGDSAQLVRRAQALQDSIQAYRQKTMQLYPKSFVTYMLKATLEPEVPENDPAAQTDSLFAYRYTKAHFWDHLPFYEDKMVRTPFLEAKLDRYFNELVYQNADSVKREMDWMLGYAAASETMQHFLLRYFLNRYGNRKEAWSDAVFLHMFDNHLNGKNFSWMSPAFVKNLTDRANRIMATHKGQPAPDITALDLNGKPVSLSGIKAPYVLLVVWDVTCPHCREQLPRLNEKYLSAWKAKGLRIFAFSKESDGKPEAWRQYVTGNKLDDWTHVYYSKADDKARTSSGLVGYGRLYDVQALPTFYLLDSEKRIIGRKISAKQVDEILALREKK